VLVWGELGEPAPVHHATIDGAPGTVTSPPGRTRRLSRRPRVREAEEGEDDSDPGTWLVRTDDLQEKAEDPAGLQRPADRDDQADPGELAEDLSELPEARLVRTDGPVREVLEGETPIPHGVLAGVASSGSGIRYPEWDWRLGQYRMRGAIVRERRAPEGPEAWVEQVLQRHRAMIRGIRRDFEQLRPRRTVIRRQPDGADLDVDALVSAWADRRGGGTADDRFYLDTRPRRRDVGISLLVDVSASTDGWVAGNRRIVDVEKEALVMVGEALAALGDPHAILAFSGEGPGRVDIQVLKGFQDRALAGGGRTRIAGLEPGGYTRTGAALRHATAGLATCPARHRLILLLSDGRPNDLDQYEGRYGIEDTRMAVIEARLQGMHCFCLTVDREAPRYAARIFGRDYAVLSRPERLPGVLIQLLRDLVRR
jgi:nitric oxide reductase NorD protein